MVKITRKRADILDRPVDMVQGTFFAYLDAAREAYPHFTFVRTAPAAAWVFADPDDLYAVAKITYADERLRRRGKTVNTYNVFSRTIKNTTIRPENDEHHLRKSSALDKALKDLGRYVKPLTLPELVNLTSDEVNTALQGFFGPLVALRDRKRREIGIVPGTPAARYVLSMGRGARDTVPPDMASVFEFVEAHDMVEQFDLASRDVRAVVFSKTGVFVAASHIYVRYDGVPSLSIGRGFAGGEYEIYDPADVPQVIQDRVNVLNITEGMEFIPNVGVKHSDKVFYVVI